MLPRGSSTANTSESRESDLKTHESIDPARMKYSDTGNESPTYENP
jgi:hypothetical protein